MPPENPTRTGFVFSNWVAVDGEAVLNCDEVLAEFFGEKLAAAA